MFHAEVTSTPTRPVENVSTTKGLQEIKIEMRQK